MSDQQFEIKQALADMGYRKISDSVWGKPLGLTILLFDLDKLSWQQRWKNANGKILLWTTKVYHPIDDFLQWLSATENYYTKDGCVNSTNGPLDFRTERVDIAELLGSL